MIKISNIKVNVDVFEHVPTHVELLNYLQSFVVKKIHQDITSLIILKKSLDAREKDIKYIFTVAFKTNNEEKILKKLKDASLYKKDTTLDDLSLNILKKAVVVGMGPAGIFNALILNKAGFDVTIVERGKCVEERIKDVEYFFKNNVFNEESNIQFGEGGAGTFSDGKLGTNINSPYINFILETFVKYGANPDLLYEAKPHVGTDVLRRVLVNIRHSLIKLGVKIHFETKLVDFNDHEAICINNNTKVSFKYDYLILACGHSATNIFMLLKDKNIKMRPKPFSMGVRIEHLQKDINLMQYKQVKNNLKNAEYKLVAHLENGRSLYTFCMCPGGFVVNASSENGYLVCNGMSNYDRNEVNANSALLVNIEVDDYFKGDILDGLTYQKYYEKKAFEEGKGLAICQMVEDFYLNQNTTSFKKVYPSVKPSYTLGNLNKCLPKVVCDSLKEGLKLLDQKLHGFNDLSACLTGIETRSSSPIQVLRNERLETSFPNLFAIGEGAGFAGGITTSALDGIKVALEIIKGEIND